MITYRMLICYDIARKYVGKWLCVSHFAKATGLRTDTVKEVLRSMAGANMLIEQRDMRPISYKITAEIIDNIDGQMERARSIARDAVMTAPTRKAAPAPRRQAVSASRT